MFFGKKSGAGAGDGGVLEAKIALVALRDSGYLARWWINTSAHRGNLAFSPRSVLLVLAVINVVENHETDVTV